VSRPIFWQALTPLVVELVPRLRPWMSNGRDLGLKRWLFRCITDPYTNFRTVTFETTSTDGLRFTGTLSGAIQRIVWHFGVFEPNLSAFLRAHLKPGDVFVDVGANVGYFSLLAAKLVGPTGKVVAVEAAPATYDALQAALALNGVTNARAINEAAFDSVSRLAIYTVDDEENAGGASVVKAVGPPIAEVPARPLADMLTDDEIARLRLVKIDVEGAEVAAVAGVLVAVPRMPATVQFVVEVLPETRAAIIAAFATVGMAPQVLPNPIRPIDYPHEALEYLIFSRPAPENGNAPG
jgi:FkbM family methyltransferase